MQTAIYLHKPSERVDGQNDGNLFPARFRLDRLSDAQLIERCRQDDHAAFDVFIGRYDRPIYILAYRLARNREVAQDVAAETRVLIYRSMSKLRDANTLLAWINRIVTNVYYNTHRRAHRRPAVSLDELIERNGETVLGSESEAATSPQEQAEASERRSILNVAINSLPANQCLLVTLFHRQGRSYEDIAERLHLPIGTVKSRLFRARFALREMLDPEIDGNGTRGTGGPSK